MSKRFITVNVEGYGKIKVKKPEQYNMETYADGIAEAVTAVMNLVAPGTQAQRFHPAMGIGGYTHVHSVGRPSAQSDRGDA